VQFGLARGQRLADAGLQPVDRRAHLLAFLRRHRPQHLQPFGDGALLAEGRHAHGFERRLVGSGRDLGQQSRLKRFQVCHLFGHGVARLPLSVPFRDPVGRIGVLRVTRKNPRRPCQRGFPKYQFSKAWEGAG
jgi:hypothetical protein